MQIAGYILAGGDNRRMEGKKKLHLKRGGKTFCQWICEAFSDIPAIYFSVAETETESRNQRDCSDVALGIRQEGQEYPFPVIKDCYGHIGPMGGIASGLKQCKEDALFVVACDMPFISKESVRTIWEVYNKKRIVTIACSGKRLQPLFGIYPKTLLPVLLKLIQNGNYRMMDVLNQVKYETVDLGDNCIELKNINTRAQYEELKTPFIFAVSGYKNSGKTTLITKLIPILVSKGYQVAVIKHDGHDFESDVPETDSYRHQKSGAYGTAIFSKNRIMITKKIKDIDETCLFAAFPEADIILIEGLKNSSYPKYICNYPKEQLIEAEKLADYIVKIWKEL